MINIRGIFAEKNHVGFALHNLLGKSILITFFNGDVVLFQINRRQKYFPDRTVRNRRIPDNSY